MLLKQLPDEPILLLIDPIRLKSFGKRSADKKAAGCVPAAFHILNFLLKITSFCLLSFDAFK